MASWVLCLETWLSFGDCFKWMLLVASTAEEVVMGWMVEEVAGASEGRR